MVDFYRRVLQGEPRAEVLRQARLALRDDCPDPYYWGAFVCLGDPRPLSTVAPRIGGLPRLDGRSSLRKGDFEELGMSVTDPPS
jgi:CHAT domain